MVTLQSIKESLDEIQANSEEKLNSINPKSKTNPLESKYDKIKLKSFLDELDRVRVILNKSNSPEEFSLSLNKDIDTKIGQKVDKKTNKKIGIYIRERFDLPNSDEDTTHSVSILEKRAELNGRILLMAECKILMTNIDGELTKGIAEKLGLDKPTSR